MKRKVALILVATMGASLFTGCANSSPDAAKTKEDKETAAVSEAAKDTQKTSSDEVTISMECITSPALTTEFWTNYFKKAEEKLPGIKIEPVFAPGTERAEWRKTKYAAGDSADICMEAIEYASIPGALAEIPEELVQKCDPALISKYNDKVLLLPVNIQMKSQCFYNKTAFKDAGITEVPKTWKEFTDACAKLKEKGTSPLMACKESWFNYFGYGCAVMQPDMADANPNFLADLKSGKEKWNNPAMVESCERWQELYNNDYYIKGYASYSYAQAVDEFFKGTSAMIFNGSWMAPQIDQLETDPGFEIGVFPIPSVDGAKSLATATGMWGVFSTCKNPEAAFKVIDCLISQQDLLAEYLKADNLMSATKEPVTYDATPMVKQFNDNCEDLKKIVDFQAMTGDNALPSGFGDIINDSFSAIAMGADITETLDLMDEEYTRMNK